MPENYNIAGTVPGEGAGDLVVDEKGRVECRALRVPASDQLVDALRMRLAQYKRDQDTGVEDEGRCQLEPDRGGDATKMRPGQRPACPQPLPSHFLQ